MLVTTEDSRHLPPSDKAEVTAKDGSQIPHWQRNRCCLGHYTVPPATSTAAPIHHLGFDALSRRQPTTRIALHHQLLCPTPIHSDWAEGGIHGCHGRETPKPCRCCHRVCIAHGSCACGHKQDTQSRENIQQRGLIPVLACLATINSRRTIDDGDCSPQKNSIDASSNSVTQCVQCDCLPFCKFPSIR